MKYPSIENIFQLHRKSILHDGGEDGIRDQGLLESAYYAPLASFGSVEAYPSAIEKAVRLSWGLIKNHPFVDGNKRVGALVLLVFLDLNQIELSLNENELAEESYRIANGEHSYEAFLDWTTAHMICEKKDDQAHRSENIS